jgi:solute carrier family 25 protein 16
MSAVLCTYPLDVIRARLAFQVKGEHIYSGLLHAIKSILHVEGKTAFFKGITPTLLGMVPYAG